MTTTKCRNFLKSVTVTLFFAKIAAYTLESQKIAILYVTLFCNVCVTVRYTF